MVATRQETTSNRFNVADILATETCGGEVRANIGFSDTGKGIGANEAMWWGSDGFISRPNDPDDDGACMAWFFADGNDRRLLAYRDNRFADKVGELEPGDRAIISSGEARFFLKTGNDSVTLYTESQVDDGQSMMVSLEGSTGEITISTAGAFIKMKNDEITIGVAGGKTIVTIDESGVQIDGNQFRCATKSGHLGILGPQVAPLVGANSILGGLTGLAAVPSTAWTVAPA